MDPPLEEPPILDPAQRATLRDATSASEQALAEGRISAAIRALAPAEALALPPEERARLRLRRAEAGRWLHRLGEVRQACERPPEAERARAARLAAWLALELGRPADALAALEAARSAGDPLTDAWLGAALAAAGLGGQPRIEAAIAALEGEARFEAQLLLARASGADPAEIPDPPRSPLLHLAWRRACLDHARRRGEAARAREERAAAAALADAIAALLDPDDAPAWALHREILGL